MNAYTYTSIHGMSIQDVASEMQAILGGDFDEIVDWLESGDVYEVSMEELITEYRNR
jgi:hypothetical protein